MPRTCAFCPGVPLRHPLAQARARCAAPNRSGFSPRAALVAVELAAAAAGGGGDGSGGALAVLAPGGPHYLLYVGSGPREAVLADVERAGLPEGDAVCSPGGLFQKGYVTPDPLWAKRCWGAWDPVPARWVVREYFGERLSERKGNSTAAGGGGDLFEEQVEMEMIFDVAEGGGELIALREELGNKLSEMGVAGSVGLRGGSGAGGCVVVRPAGAPPGEVVCFCAEMLKKKGGEVFAFGSALFVEAALTEVGDGARGVVPAGETAMDGVFAAAGQGEDALVEGLRHFGMLDESEGGARP